MVDEAVLSDRNAVQWHHPLQYFTAQHLLFQVEAEEMIRFGDQPGTAIRGALYHALIDLFSPQEPIPDLPLDPVRHLLEGEDDNNARGRNIPRAFAVQPPLPISDNFVRSGQRFAFGVTLFGTGIALLPYILRATKEMQRLGLGSGRGRFRIIRIYEHDPLNDEKRALMQQDRVVQPYLAISHQRVEEEVRTRHSDQVTVQFLTPTRLIERGVLLRQPRLGVLLRRLIERAQALAEQYTPADLPVAPREVWREAWERMGESGDAIDQQVELPQLVRWTEAHSYSSQRGRSSPISGFMGQARWTSRSAEVMKWLLWGQSLQVGKNTPKGDGWYTLR